MAEYRRHQMPLRHPQGKAPRITFQQTRDPGDASLTSRGLSCGSDS